MVIVDTEHKHVPRYLLAFIQRIKLVVSCVTPKTTLNDIMTQCGNMRDNKEDYSFKNACNLFLVDYIIIYCGPAFVFQSGLSEFMQALFWSLIVRGFSMVNLQYKRSSSLASINPSLSRALVTVLSTINQSIRVTDRNASHVTMKNRAK